MTQLTDMLRGFLPKPTVTQADDPLFVAARKAAEPLVAVKPKTAIRSARASVFDQQDPPASVGYTNINGA